MQAPKQFALPFAAQAENRTDPFSSEAEAAAIFALSEIERKSGGFTNREEKIAYISKVGYPLWLIVRGDSTYVFDGLSKSIHVWSYYEASQTEFMIGDFDASFKIREEYLKFLVNYQRSFQQSLSRRELPCEGLIADSVFLSEFKDYLKEATEVYSQTAGLLLPVLKETEATAVADQIETLQLAFREKTEKLKQLTGLIIKTTKGFVEGLNFESNAVAEEAEAKIKAQKEIINPKIEKLTHEYKKQVERLEKSFDKEQTPLENKQSRIEKTVKETEATIERYGKQAKTQANKKNKRSENSLKKKIKNEKHELDELKKQLKHIEKQLEALAEQKTNETSKLKREFDEKVQVERQPITALEASRDQKQESFKQEILKLENLTQPVMEELNRFVAQRESILANMEPVNLESDPKVRNNALLYVPFYVAVYGRADANFKRYHVFSPAIVGSLGFSAKLKGAFGMAKIKGLLSERFKAVAVLGEKIRLNTSSSSEFEAQLEALSQKGNILTANKPIKDGLFLLKSEGWFSESEYQNFVSAYNATKVTA